MSASRLPPLALLLAATSACRSAPEPLTLPEVAPSVRYTAQAANPTPTTSTTFHIELLALRTAPTGTAVAEAAASIIRDRGMPFRGKSSLPIGTRWLDHEQVERWREGRSQLDASELQSLGTTAAIVAPGLVTSLAADVSELPTIVLTPAQGQIAVTLVTEADGREQLQLATDLQADHGAALFVPAGRLAVEGLGGSGFMLQLMPTGSAAAEQLAAAASEAMATNAAASVATRRPREWQVALEAVGEGNRRPALLALASPMGLTRIVDLLLAADESALAAITDRLAAVDPTADDVGWATERAAWQAVVPRIERRELTPAMLAAALRHLGAIADDPSTLRLLLQTSRDSAGFAGNLHEENLAALADPSAALRMTAHSWLGDRDTTVADYDPLADKPSRRRAMRRFWNTRLRQGIR